VNRSKISAFDRQMQKHDNLRKAELDGNVADSMAVRVALIDRMNAGELTLDQVKAELARIKREAKKNGKITRKQAFRGY
jgi:hypothetical protein